MNGRRNVKGSADISSIHIPVGVASLGTERGCLKKTTFAYTRFHPTVVLLAAIDVFFSSGASPIRFMLEFTINSSLL